mgnify:CR=1 FL=1
MLKRLWIGIFLMMISLGLLLVTSCGKKTVLTEQISKEANTVLEEKIIKQKEEEESD